MTLLSRSTLSKLKRRPLTSRYAPWIRAGCVPRPLSAQQPWLFSWLRLHQQMWCANTTSLHWLSQPLTEVLGSPWSSMGLSRIWGDLTVQRVIKGTKNPELVGHFHCSAGQRTLPTSSSTAALQRGRLRLDLWKDSLPCRRTLWHCAHGSLDAHFCFSPRLQDGPGSSPTFLVFVRVPHSLVNTLLQIQCPKVFFEPRQEGQGNDDRYRVIWLPARSYDEAIHACKSCVHALGLARSKMKYGVRVRSDHEEASFKFLRTDSTYVDTLVQRVFQLFPLPHGLQRAGVQKLLESVKWTAKPLQPGRSSASALSWQVGASDGPPTNVFAAFDQEVIITELTKEQKPKPPPRFVASGRAQKHQRSEVSSSSSTSSVDPWLQKDADPWFHYKGTNATKGTTGKQHLQEVTGLLRQELTSSLQKEIEILKSQKPSVGDGPQLLQNMEANEKRFHKLETSVDAMRAHNQQFSQLFNTMGQQLQGAEAAIQTINYTLSVHQAELIGLQAEVKSVSEQIGNKLNVALTQHKDHISNEFDQRFSRLEALFEKRRKSGEWLSGAGPMVGHRRSHNTLSLRPLFNWLLWIFIFFDAFLGQATALVLPFADLKVPSAAPFVGDRDLRSGANKLQCCHDLAFPQPPAWHLGARIGEALHPGPSSRVVVGCSNPGVFETKNNMQ